MSENRPVSLVPMTAALGSKVMKIMLRAFDEDPALADVDLEQAHRVLSERHRTSAENFAKSKNRRPPGKPRNDWQENLLLMEWIDRLVSVGAAKTTNAAIMMVAARLKEVARSIKDGDLRAKVEALATRDCLQRRYKTATKRGSPIAEAVGNFLKTHSNEP